MSSSSRENSPDITVVTAVLNGASHLRQCLESVQAQAGIRHEHIVIDGGSRDGSIEIIRNLEAGLSHWISEPDVGISDAMNKGIALARGQWILFLHADDYLIAPDSLSNCLQRLSTSKADVVGFPIHFGLPEAFRVARPRNAGLWLNLKMGFPHQGCFTRRALFERFGAYDTGLRIDMDYEFLLRVFRQGAVIEATDGPAPSFMRATGLSSQRDWSSLQRRFSEERAIHLRHAGNHSLRLFYRAYWPVYISYRRLRWRWFP